jgi:hypothetical protein
MKTVKLAQSIAAFDLTSSNQVRMRRGGNRAVAALVGGLALLYLCCANASYSLAAVPTRTHTFHSYVSCDAYKNLTPVYTSEVRGDALLLLYGRS